MSFQEEPPLEECDSMSGRISRQNLGNQVTLRGSDVNLTGKLLRLQEVVENGELLDPYTVAITSTTVVAGGGAALLNAVIKGNFGTGGVSHNFECDVVPDSVIALPGTSLDLDVAWDVGYFIAAGGVQTIRGLGVGNEWLPTSTTIRACMKHGSPTQPNATRTFSGFVNSTTSWRRSLPAFSNYVMLYPQDDTGYTNVTLSFFSSNVQIITYTGAQLLALKAAGHSVPVPGNATEFALSWSAAPSIAFFLTFELNL